MVGGRPPGEGRKARRRGAGRSAGADGRQQEAQRRAAELEATIAAIPDGLVICGPSGEVLRRNAAADRMLGFSTTERGLSIAERLALLRAETAEGRPFLADEVPLLRALRGETVVGTILRFQPRERPAIVVSCSAAPIRGPEGAILGAVVTLADVTRLHELQDLREDLMQTVSHDLRAPLAIVQGQAQWVLRLLRQAQQAASPPPADRLERSVEAIVTGARRMNAMIQDLVDAARLESGQLPIDRQPLDLGAFLAELLERAAPMLDVGRIELQVAEGLPPVSADANRLERILLNLLINALKYSPPEGEVVIRARRTDGEVLTAVVDRGPGIPAEEFPRLFQRFYRVKGGQRREGLGLGLYITRMLVEAHGGRIGVESAVGRGSTFWFALPVA